MANFTKEQNEILSELLGDKEMTTWYRLVYRNGHRGAWTTDFARIRANAEMFGARIETKTC